MQTSLFAPKAFIPDWPDDKRLIRPEPGWQERVFRELSEAPDLFIDFETNGLDPMKGHRTFMVSYFSPEFGSRCIDFRIPGIEQKPVWDGLDARRSDLKTYAFHLAFELAHARAMNCCIGGEWRCSMMMAWALNEKREPWNEFGPMTQKAIVYHELGIVPRFAVMLETWMKINLGTKETGWDLVPASLMVPYNLEDVEQGYQLTKHLEKQCIANGQLDMIRHDSIVDDMCERIHERGMLIDVDRGQQLLSGFSADLKVAQQKFVDATGGLHIDPTKNQQLIGLLFGTYKLPMHSDIEKQGKLDEDVLEWLLTIPECQDTPQGPNAIRGALEAILDIREFEKLRGTYLMPWLYEWKTPDNRLLPNLHMCIVRTRRFSSSNPALQTVPKRTDRGASLREVFVTRPEYETYSMDLSQVQPRCFSHYSNEPELIKGYCTDPDFDMHQAVSDLLGVPRKDGKHLNMGALFGLGKNKLARKLLRSIDAAAALLAKYHARFPNIPKLNNQLKEQIKMFGYVKDVLGGRCHLKAGEGYAALAALCQLSEANIMRRAMARSAPILEAVGGNPLLQVHDDFIFELPGKHGPEHIDILRRIKTEAMENNPEFKVPITTSCERWAPNWRTCEEVVL